MSWLLILVILGSFAAGCGVTLWEVGAFTRLREKSAHVDRLADPTPLPDELDQVIEVEVFDSGEVTAVRTFPSLLDALSAIANDLWLDVRTGEFTQITITNIDETESAR